MWRYGKPGRQPFPCCGAEVMNKPPGQRRLGRGEAYSLMSKLRNTPHFLLEERFTKPPNGVL